MRTVHRRLKTPLLALVGILFATGAGYLLLRYGLSITVRDPWHPYLRFMLVSHGVASAVCIALSGAFLFVHAPAEWGKSMRRFSGTSLYTCLTLVIITTVVLYYCEANFFRTACIWIHVACGTALVPLIFFHARKKKKA